MDTNAGAPTGTQIQYIGSKATKFDAWCGSRLTWFGRGDVQTVADQKVVGRLLSFTDVWRVYDPDAPMPDSPMHVEALHAAATGDTKTLLASLQVILAALGKNPAAAAMLGAIGITPPAPGGVADRLAKLEDNKPMVLADDPLSAPPQPEVPDLPKDPPAAAVHKPANVDERELLLENLRREARELGIAIKSAWGATSLKQAIDVRRAQVQAAAEGAAATAALHKKD